MIAITGAAGKTGHAIAGALGRRKKPFRALVHRPPQADHLRSLGASEVRSVDLTDLGTVTDGFSGCRTVYHICPNMRADEVEIGERVIEACKRSGVERLVLHSVLHPQIEAMPHHWRKLRVEERLIESGLAFTILQPAAYMQNLKAQWPHVATRGVLEIPYAETTRLAMVDLADVAEAAGRVLSGSQHVGATYELCGPESLDQAEVAAILGRQLARTVLTKVVDREEWALRARGSGLSEQAIHDLLAMFVHYERYGFCGSPTVLEKLLGRPPRRLGEVVQRWLEEPG